MQKRPREQISFPVADALLVALRAAQ